MACRPFRRPSWEIVFLIFSIILGNIVQILFFRSGVFDVSFHLVRSRGPTMKISLILSRLKCSWKNRKKWKSWKINIFGWFRTIRKRSFNSWGQNMSIYFIWGQSERIRKISKIWFFWFFFPGWRCPPGPPLSQQLSHVYNVYIYSIYIVYIYFVYSIYIVYIYSIYM